MMTLATLESTLITAAQTALGNAVRKVAPLPGAWSIDLLRQVLQTAPAVYVAFLGGGAAARPADAAVINARLGVYVCVNHALEAQRRLGTQQVIGAYEMIERLVPVLHNLVVPDIGTLRLVSIDNLFGEVVQELGGSVYGIILELPNLAFEYTADLASLDEFVTFHAEIDSTPADPDDNPIATDHVTLPQ